MRIASTTLTGNNRDVIADALASVVGWVDLCLVIDTGVSDDTLEVAKGVAGDKLLVRQFPWQDDFGAARNFALDAAAEAGADWAITVDTDERILPGGEDLRAVLASTDVAVLMMPIDGGSYTKDRCFRLPAAQRWVGATHEAYPSYHDSVGHFATARFTELRKSAEQLRVKFERDAAMLRRSIETDPDNPRWHFYLGESLRNLGRHEEAIPAYDACAALRGWNEESAWACYRAAECCTVLERWRDAVDRCATGLGRHAAVVELAWLAGFSSYRLGRYDQAIAWARTAAAGGEYRPLRIAVPGERIGFRHLPGLYEGPWDVIRWSRAALGDAAGAEEARRTCEAAMAARLAYEKRPHEPERPAPAVAPPQQPTKGAGRKVRFSAKDPGGAAVVRPVVVSLPPPDDKTTDEPGPP